MPAANNILRNFALSVAGTGYAGNADEVQLPTLAIKTEDFMAGGMDASTAIDMGMEKMELTFKLNDKAAAALATFGVIGGPDPTFNFRGALQNLDGSVSSLLVQARGRTKSIKPTVAKVGARADDEYAVDLNYYSYAVDGSVIHLIDVLNGIRMIDGVDQLANIRAALGL